MPVSPIVRAVLIELSRLSHCLDPGLAAAAAYRDSYSDRSSNAKVTGPGTVTAAAAAAALNERLSSLSAGIEADYW